MKPTSTLLLALAIVACILPQQQAGAQVPEKLSYQAVIRNSSDQLVTNTNIGMQISILQGSLTGAALYVERHTPSTNANGLVSIEIGAGTVVSGNFAAIDWANGPYFIKTETDPSGGISYSITGTSQILSVPYAFYAEKAGNEFSGDYSDLSNKPDLSGFITTETDPVFDASEAKKISDAGSGKVITDAERSKLSGIQTGAEVNVNADWKAASGDAQILNKPDMSGFITTETDPTWDGSVNLNGDIARSGNVGIGTYFPAALLHIKGTGKGEGNVLFEGYFKNPPSSAGFPPARGEGTRMMWYPDLAAFRVGSVWSTNWDKDSIGNNSIAMGYDTKAKGNCSIATGDATTASGNYSTAMGGLTIASGYNSTAMNYRTVASGAYSTAMGFKTTASGDTSIAMGSKTTALGTTSISMGSCTKASGNYSTAMGAGTIASGYCSTSMGNFSTASGANSIAMGASTKASGIYSTAMGEGTTASGTYSTSMGNYTTASGDYSTAMGLFANALGSRSTAMGGDTRASGILSTAMGVGTIASGDRSTAMGSVTTASGTYSTSMGQNTTASGLNSTAMGINTTASGNYSTAMGAGSTASGYYCTAMGTYSTASGFASTALGYIAKAIGDYSFAINLNGGTGPDVGISTFRISGASAIGGNLAWTNWSDQRLKKDIQTLNKERNLAKIMQLNGVRFRWKDNDSLLYLGFIAQEVKDIIPECVRYDELNDIYSMEYTAIIPVLVEGIKEQQEMIKAQQLEIESLEKQINKLLELKYQK